MGERQSCFLPYLLYTYSLTGLEAGKASVYTNIESVVATFAGVFVFHEAMTAQNVIGIVLVLSAVIFLKQNESNKREAQ